MIYGGHAKAARPWGRAVIGVGGRLRASLRLLGHWLDRRPWVGLLLAVEAAAFMVGHLALTGGPVDHLANPGTDYRIYMDAAERVMAGGLWYPDWQLAGPYDIDRGPVLYPPSSIGFFLAATFLPTILWWAIPLAIVAGVVLACRPRPWTWPLLVMGLLYGNTIGLVLAGNPVMWAVAALALGTRYGWPAAFVLIKPSLAPFALFGIRSLDWWRVAVLFALLALLTLPLWPDYLTTLDNMRGERAGLLYSIRDVPFMLVPLLAWAGRSHRAVELVDAEDFSCAGAEEPANPYLRPSGRVRDRRLS